MSNSKLYNIIKKNDIARLCQCADSGTFLDGFRYSLDDYHHKDSPIPTIGLTLLHLAAYYDAYECLIFLIENGRSPNILSSYMIPPLHYAIFGEASECTKTLLNLGADPNFVVAYSGVTPLFLSARCKTADICKTLLKYGAKYSNTKNLEEKELSPLREAIRFKRADIVSLLYESQFNRKMVDASILMDAISKRMYDCVELLLQNHCDPNFKSKSGQSALTLACVARRADIVGQLLSYGANSKTLFDQNKTFLHYAAASGDPEIIKMAIDTGINVNALDKYGKLASFYVSNYTQLESIKCYKLLFDAGIDINAICNGMHIMSVILANKKTSPEVVSFLMKSGADLDLKLSTGKTLYEMGMIMASSEVKEVLAAWKPDKKLFNK